MATSTINYKWAADLVVGDVIRVKKNNHKITAFLFTPTKRHVKLILDGQYKFRMHAGNCAIVQKAI